LLAPALMNSNRRVEDDEFGAVFLFVPEPGHRFARAPFRIEREIPVFPFRR
jgi:hypothetical protein